MSDSIKKRTRIFAVVLLALGLSQPLAAKPGGGNGKPGGGGGGDPTPNPALVYQVWISASPGGIEKIDADGSNRTVILGGTNSGCSYPRWSPTGERILAAPSGPYIFNSDGTGQSALNLGAGVAYSGACSHDWSQGPVPGAGTELLAIVGQSGAQSDAYDVYLLDPAGADPAQPLATALPNQLGWIGWSKDGDRLAVFTKDFDNREARLWVLELGVGLADGTCGASGSAQAQGTVCVVESHDVSSFLSWVWNPLGTTSTKFSWSSTSNDRIALSFEEDLYYVDLVSDGQTLVGAEATQLTGGPGQFDLGREQSPTWSPDDREIAFVVTGGSPKLDGLYRMNVVPSSAEFGVAELILPSRSKGSDTLVSWPDWNPAWPENQ